MTPHEIRVPISQKLNVDEYETVDVTVELVGGLEGGDTFEQAFDQIYTEAQKLWRKSAILQMKQVIARRRAIDKPYDRAEATLRALASTAG